MSKKILLIVLAILFVIQGFDAMAQEAQARYELLNLIRKDKFDKVLPGAMRDNNVDMWIHVIRRGDPDAFALDFGVTMGYVIFSDRGGDRIERALLGVSFASVADRSVYDIFGPESDIPKFVAERDPKRIAVNMSKSLTHADGLSYTGYLKLVNLLGDTYAQKLVSSEDVITDFRVRRVQTEIIAFAKACEIQRRIMEEALSSIVPGLTTKEELGWWAQDQLLALGIESSYYGAGTPGVQHSEISDRSEIRRRDYAFQRGDLISWDWGIRYLNFGTDYKRKAYILREGESSLPPSIQKAWDRGIKAREILRKTFKPGQTAGETLKIIVKAIEDAGFVYTPFTDTDKDREIVQSLGDEERSGFSIDSHCVGNTGNSEIAVGPSLSPFRPYRAHLMVQPNNLIAFEFIVHTWIPEWGERLAINFEDNAIVTERGIEALYPRNEKMILVR
ncbi:MAG: M24 family metallopeptidase [Candidatus Aminicenantaceae bacterium]|jgi:Xaa-Pro dipeptidase